MSDASDIKCLSCCEQIERVRYFPRELLTADDMRVEQEYFREKHRRHNRFLHGWGVVCGCAVEPVPGAKTWTVRVCPGYAVAPQGDEILIDDCRDVNLQLGTQEPCTVRWPCPPTGAMPAAGKDGLVSAYIAVRYAECFARPTRVHPSGCGCDESACEYSRIRDSYEIKVLWKLPDSHVNAAKDDLAWLAALKQGSATSVKRQLGRFPVPPCPECELDPWVVLAMVTFPSTAQSGSSNAQIQVSYDPRRTLLATQRMQTVLSAL